MDIVWAMNSVLTTQAMSKWQRLGRDYAYVLASFPLAVFSFSLLLSMTVISIATFVVWVGALLLPLTLMTATGFAELSRTRVRFWGIDPGPVKYRPAGEGLFGNLRLAADPRRWFDLVFETFIVLPMRVVTFAIAVVWSVGGPGGVTYFFWSTFIPGERGLIKLLRLIDPGLVPESHRMQYLLDSGVFFTVGVLFLLTLPAVMRGVAWMDALVTASLLGGADGYTAAPTHPRDAEGAWAGRNTHLTALDWQTWSWVSAGFLATVLVAVGWPVIAVVHSVNAALAMVLVTAHCGAVLLALRWAAAAILLSWGASGALMAITANAAVSVWPWPVTAMITQSVVLTVLALTQPWYSSVVAWSGGILLSIAAWASVPQNIPSGFMANSVLMVSASACMVILAIWTRTIAR